MIKQARIPNMIEKRMKKREEENGMKKTRGKIPSVLRHQSFQHVNLIVWIFVSKMFRIFLE